jgi:hypothetical protein
MSDAVPREHETWSPTLARRVDQVCNQFEAAWQAGQRPCLDDCLGAVPEPERPILARELIALDIAYRQRLG